MEVGRVGGCEGRREGGKGGQRNIIYVSRILLVGNDIIMM